MSQVKTYGDAASELSARIDSAISRFEVEIARLGNLADRLAVVESYRDHFDARMNHTDGSIDRVDDRINGMASARDAITDRVVALEVAFANVVATAGRGPAPEGAKCAAINRHDSALVCDLTAATCERGRRHKAADGRTWGRAATDRRVGDPEPVTGEAG